MAKDKEKDKQLLKQGDADDKAITFQRAVFIVCNLKRLIKRPKKDDKQSGSRKRSGYLAAGDCDPNKGRRGRRGTKEPVRRAFTLPSVVCSSVLARLLASNSGGPTTENRVGPSNGAGPEVGPNDARASSVRVSRLVAPHQQYQDGSASSDSLSDCQQEASTSVPTGSAGGSFGRATSSGLTYLATPVRRLNQSLAARSTAAVAQKDLPGAHKQTTVANSVKELVHQEHQEQLMCPIWGHVMDQLDALQGRSSLAEDERQLARVKLMSQQLGDQLYLSERHKQQQQQVQVRVQVVGAGTTHQRRASNDECAAASSRRLSSKDAHAESPRYLWRQPCLSPRPRNKPLFFYNALPNTRSNPTTPQTISAASPCSDVCCYTGPTRNPLDPSEEAHWLSGSRQALDSLECHHHQELDHQSASSTSRHNRKKHHHHPSTGTRSRGKQPMKRFSSALCLADHSSHSAQVPSASSHLRGDTSPIDTQSNLDQQALFSAVERNLVERVRAILERGGVDVNRLTQDKFSCLDMAVLLRNLDMVRLLQQYGAQESFPQMTREARANQLYALYCEAKRTVEDLTRSVGAFVSLTTDHFPASIQPDNCMPSSATDQPTFNTPECPNPTSQQPQPQLMLATGSILSSALLEEKHLQLQCWRRRLDLFMHMRYELERLQVPSEPELVVLQVVGESSLGLKIVHSLHSTTPARGCVLPGGFASRIQAPPGRLSCRRGAACSHWLLDELAVWQPLGVCGGTCTSTTSQQFPPNSGNRYTCKQVDTPTGASERKLAVFNQLLAHQLEQLQTGEQESSNNFTSGTPGAPVSSVMGVNPGKQGVANRRLHAQLSSGACESSSRLEAREADEISLAYQLMSCAAEGRAHGRSVAQPSIITKYLIEWALEDGTGGEGGGVGGADVRDGDADKKEDGRGGGQRRGSGCSFRPTGSLIIHNSQGGFQQHPGLHQQPLKCRIENLESGRRYRVRVAAGNQAGFSVAQTSSPASLAPSSWRQLDGLRRRRQDDEEIFRKFTKLFLLNKHLLDERHAGPVAATSKSSLINMLMVDATSIPSAPSGLTSGRSSHPPTTIQPLTQSSTNPVTAPTPGSVRKNLKNFFQTSSFKFQKLTNQNKRGLYLAAIVFTPAPTTSAATAAAATGSSAKEATLTDKLADRVVVTNDDRLPVVEISNELVAPAALMSDFYWLLKINGAQWVDIKQLRQQLQRSHSSSNLHLRIKLLNAIEQLQLALNLNDIGHLFYRPIKAHDGSQVICTCKQVSSTKQVSSLSTKWMQLDKILPRHLRKISESFKRRQSNQQPSSSNANKPSLPVKPDSLRVTPVYDYSAQQQQQQQQHQVPLLTKRRPTMASNSSNSSLASSGGDNASGHWSQQAIECRGSTQSSCNQPAVRINQAIAMTTTNRSNSGRSASLMVTPQTLPMGASLLNTQQQQQQQQQQQASQLPRHSQPAAAYNSGQPTSSYLLQSSLSIYDLLLYNVQEILQFYFSSRKPLSGGLYLGFLQLQTTVESMRLLVPRARPNMVPCLRIRDNPHVSREEWALLREFANTSHTTSSSSGAPIIVSTNAAAANQHLANQCGASDRSSDPSIWPPMDGGLQTSSNRDRAKSITPGYLLQQHQLQHREKKLLSVSTEHLGSTLFLRPGGGPICVGKEAYSDTELSGGGDGGGGEKDTRPLEFCRMAPTASLSTADVAGIMGEQRRRNSSGSHCLTVDSRTRPPSYVGPAADVPVSFLRLVASTAKRLLNELKSQLPQVVSGEDGSVCSVLDALNNQSSNRIYHTELIELSDQVAVILLLPAPENVCPVTSQDKSNYLADNKHYMFLPLQIFETIHISTYEADLLGKYSRLSTILETDLVVAQHDHRQAFSNNELKSTKSRVSHLQDMVSMADEFWRKLRWIVDVVAFARDKSGTLASQLGGTIRLNTIWRYLELSGPQSGGAAVWDLGGQQSQQPSWRGSGGCLVELEEPTGSHRRLSGSNQHLPELILNESSSLGRGESSRSSRSTQYGITQEGGGREEEEDEEEAIYAYHVSLRDASRAAAAKRRSSQLPASCNVSIEPPKPRARSTIVHEARYHKSEAQDQQGASRETTIKPASDVAAPKKPHHLSSDSLSPAKTRAGELLSFSAESLEGRRAREEILAGGKVLSRNPSASGCSWPPVMEDPAAFSLNISPGASGSVASGCCHESSISGPSAAQSEDLVVGGPAKLANDKLARINAGSKPLEASGSRASPNNNSSTNNNKATNAARPTNRMAHLRTTNPFLSDSLD